MPQALEPLRNTLWTAEKMFSIWQAPWKILQMMKYLDSHCHLHDSRIIEDIDSLVSRAGSAGVRYMATCATMEENFDLTVQLHEKYDSILPFFGIHPWFIGARSDDWKNQLETYLLKYRAGVGETGLDFTDKTWDRGDQILVFEHHVKLAVELRRPINIHVRKAWDMLNQILRKIGRLPVPGVVHSYSGSADMVPLLEKYNLYISFSGAVTRPNARKVETALKSISKDRFVLETDTPDIFPTLDEFGDGKLPLHQMLNEPAYLPDIAKIAARRAGVSEQIFADQAYGNSINLFAPLLHKGKNR